MFACPNACKSVGQRRSEHRDLGKGANVKVAQVFKADGCGDTKEADANARKFAGTQAFVREKEAGEKHPKNGCGTVENGGEAAFYVKL